MTHTTFTKKALALAALLTMGLAANAQPAVPEGYEQVFADEFNGTALDTRVWNTESNGDGGGNQELQYYLPSNVSVANGHLVITARRQSYGGKSFTSGRINTMGKVAFKHGMVQASIKLPRTANGLWPAFWLMGNDLNSGTSWPYCGEIDVLEAGGSQGITEGTQERFFVSALHWGPYQNGQHPMYSRTTTASYSLQDGQFHTYTMMWDQQKISMYLDDDTEPYFEMNINDTSQQNSAGNYFHKQFFLLLNVAVGGNIPGILDPGGITALNGGEQTMEVDYVRVYQKADEKNYFTPDGSEGDDGPGEIEEDTTTQLGRYGSLSLDESGSSTFDFTNATDFVVIGASQGVIDQMGDRVRADYSVDDENNFLYIWEKTYTAKPSEGVNSFGLEEEYNRFIVNSVGWSGLGYASTGGTGAGKDLSMLAEDGYYLHFAMKGNDVVRHASHTVGVGSAQFVIGNSSSGPIMLGDYRRDGQWYSFDIPLAELRSLYGEMFTGDGGQNAFKGNVISFLSGGATGTELQFDNVFFYKRHSDDGTAEDIDPVLGRYGSPALDDDGHATFDLTAGRDYVLIALGEEEAQQIKALTLADYRPNDTSNFLYIWEGTYQSTASQGVNSMGYEEEYTAVKVANGSWSGLGFASTGGTGTGKDLSMIDDSYYLHFAIKGDDAQHVSHAIWAGSAKFSLGRAAFNDNGTLYGLLGDFYRDGKWYNFDIPVSKLQEFANPIFDNAGNYLDNAIALLSGGNQGVNVSLDAVFFYRKDAIPPTSLLGDVNNDSEVSVADVTALVNIILENEAPSVEDYPSADVNKDGEVSVADITALVNILMEQE